MPGIGGAFLSSHDPKRLMDWFQEALGIEMQEEGTGGMALFQTGDSIAILAIHAAKNGAPEPPEGAVEAEPYGRQNVLVNLRVDDLDATLQRLQENGDEVAGPTLYEGIGRFAWTRTPDGHDLELWQP